MSFTGIILIVGSGIIVVITTIYITALLVAAKTIFKGSGTPISMALTLLSSITRNYSNYFRNRDCNTACVTNPETSDN